MGHDLDPDYEPLGNPKRRRSLVRDLDDESFGARKHADDKRFRQPVAEPFQRAPAIVEVVSQPASNPKTDSELIAHSFLKRGHGLSFFGLLIFTGFVYFRPYEFLPGLTFLTSGAKWIAILTLLVYVPTQLGLEGNLTSRPREVNLLLLLTFTALLSLPTAISFAEGWDNFTEYLKVVAMFIVMVNVVRTEGRLRWMFWVALAVSITTSFSAISDYQAGRLALGGGRIKGSIGGLFENPNDLALHLVTMVPLAASLFLVRSGGLRRVVYGTTVLLMVAAIICTFSRGGFLGLIAVSLVLAWKLGRKNRATVIVVSLIAILAMVVFAPAQYGGRLTSIWGGDATGSSNARQELFWRSLIVALRYPITGVGMGNFHFRSLQEQVSHNSFTQVASELGIAALVFYCLFIITPLKRLKRIENETLELNTQKKFYYLSVGLQASLIGYLVSSFFASVAFLWYVYYLVGYAICMSRLYATETTADQKTAEALKPEWLRQDMPKVEAI